VGARLEIWDGTEKLLLAKDLPATKKATDGKFFVKLEEDFTVKLSEGIHRIQVKNTGRDWITVDAYLLKGLLPLTDKDIKALKSVVIDIARTFQTIEGWGGNIYPYTTRHAANDAGLYDKGFKELATTHMRIRSMWDGFESENDNDDPNVFKWEAFKKGDKGLVHDEFLMLQELSRRKVKLLFASWNYPYWIAGKPPGWKRGKGRIGLPEKEKAEAEFVESLAAYLLYARKKYGVTFYAVSIQNEPGIGVYVPVKPDQLLRVTRKLKERLTKEDYTTEYYCPDVTNMNVGYARAFFARSRAENLSCSLAYHSYRRRIPALQKFRNLARSLKRPVWVTEQQDVSHAAKDRFDWSHAFDNAVCIHDLLVYGDMSLSLFWSYVARTSGGLVMYMPEKKKWSPTYHMLKHFYNTVPPGSVRVSADPATEGRVRSVAFLLADKRLLTVVLINGRKRATTVDLMFRGITPGTFVSRESNATKRFEQTDNVSLDGTGMTVTLSPLSVTSIEIRRR
jgi:O-glycosyl hydrolase